MIEKKCQFCANWSTSKCPKSSKCFQLPDKPYWTPLKEKIKLKPVLLNEK